MCSGMRWVLDIADAFRKVTFAAYSWFFLQKLQKSVQKK